MAAGLDGDVKIGLSMNTKSAEQSLSSFRKKLRDGFSGTDTKALDQSIKQTEKTVKQLETQIEKTKQKLRDLSTSDVQPKSVIAMEKELAQLEKQLAKADSEFEKLSKEQADLADRQVPGLTIEQSLNPEQLARFQELDNLIIKNGQDTEVLNARISGLKAKLAEVKQNPQLTEEGKRYNKELDDATAEMDKQKAKLAELVSKHERISSKQNNINDNVNKTTASYQKLNRNVSKTPPILNSMQKAVKRITGLIKRVFFFSLITSALRSLRNSLGNLIKSNSEMSKSLAEIKGNLLTAFASIWEFITPAIQKLLELLNKATAAIAKFVSSLFGKTISQSKKAAQALQETTKEVKRSTYAFDELNQLSNNNDDITASFEGLTETEDFSKLNELWNSLKNTIESISNIFMTGFWEGFVDADFSGIQTAIKGINTSLTEIFTDLNVQNAASNFSKKFIKSLGEIAGSVVSIGNSIATNLLGGLDLFLSANKDNIKHDLINMFDIVGDVWVILGDISHAFATVLSSLSTNEGKEFTASIMNLLYTTFSGITNIGLEVGRDLLNAIARPFTENQDALKLALQNTFDALTPLINGVSNLMAHIFDGLDVLWTQALSPLLTEVSNLVSSVFGSILNVWNTQIAPSLKSAFSDIGTALSDNLGSALSGLLSSIGNLVQSLMPIIQPIFTELKMECGELLTIVGDLASGVIGIVSGVVTGVINLFSGVISAVSSVIDGLAGFISNLFEGNIQGAFTSLGNGILGFFKGIINAITGLISGLINAITSALSAIANAFANMWNFISGNEKTSDISIPKINIPKLASGAVLPPNEPFIAMLGDQKHGTNIEAPLDIIKQAVAETLAENYTGMNTMPESQTISLSIDGHEFTKFTNKLSARESSRIGLTLGG